MFVFVCCLDATNFSINYVCSRLFRANLTNRITIHSFFLFQKAKPAILSGIVLVEWVLANRIVHLYIQHSWKHRHRHRYKATTSPSSIRVRIDIDKLLRIAFNIKQFPSLLFVFYSFPNKSTLHSFNFADFTFRFHFLCIHCNITIFFFALTKQPSDQHASQPASQPTDRSTDRPIFIS